MIINYYISLKDNRGYRGKKKTLSLKKCENYHKTPSKNVLTLIKKCDIMHIHTRTNYLRKEAYFKNVS